MPNIEITNNKTRSLALWGPVSEDATATFTAAETWPEGAVLAKLTATGNYVRFDPTASNGSQIPKAVLLQPLEAVASGNIPFRPVISGRVRAGDLVNNTGGALTAAQFDQLRDFSIIALGTTQLAELDNQ